MAINDPFTITETDEDGNAAEFEITASDADETIFIDDIVEAVYDNGTADDNTKEFDADGDGENDATAIDTDGDGKFDSSAADLDGDGNIDSVLVDTDGDGLTDTGVMDSDGDGVVDMVSEDTDGDGMLDTSYLDTDGDGEFDTTITDADRDGEFDSIDTDGDGVGDQPIETSETQTDTPETFVDGSAGADNLAENYSGSSETFNSTPTYSADPADTVTESETPAAVETAYADEAREAQAAADEFVASGDYAAAADARYEAEQAAEYAGDDSMLGEQDAQQLGFAAEDQAEASELRDQQAEYLADGDIESAREAAIEAGYATNDADFAAGGSDHSGQSDADVANLEWAAYHEDIAIDNAESAGEYAAEGDFDRAEIYGDNVDDHAALAGDYADHANPESVMYDTDASSAVDIGGGYDMGAVDTGFDAGVDISTPDFDTGTDDMV